MVCYFPPTFTWCNLIREKRAWWKVLGQHLVVVKMPYAHFLLITLHTHSYVYTHTRAPVQLQRAVHVCERKSIERAGTFFFPRALTPAYRKCNVHIYVKKYTKRGEYRYHVAPLLFYHFAKFPSGLEEIE